MKHAIAIVLIAFFALLPAATEEVHRHHHGDEMRYDYYMEAMQEALREQGDTELGSLTLNDLNNIAGQLSISLQKSEHVARSKAASWALPGVGQFMNDEVGLGILFLSADVVVWTGAILGAYFLCLRICSSASSITLRTITRAYAAIGATTVLSSICRP